MTPEALALIERKVATAHVYSLPPYVGTLVAEVKYLESFQYAVTQGEYKVYEAEDGAEVWTWEDRDGEPQMWRDR